MEYLLGFAMAIIAIIAFRFVLAQNVDIFSIPEIRYSQSHIHEMIKYYLPSSFFYKKRVRSQSDNHEEKLYTKVVFLENQAYWIKDNALLIADLEDGVVLEETTRQVDTIGMDSVQLDKVIGIVSALTEGRKNDSGYSGYQGF
jgi:hypothetical protein